MKGEFRNLRWESRRNRLLVLLIVMALWEFIVILKIIDPFWISKPSSVVVWLFYQVFSGSFWKHLSVTLQETLIGYFLGSLLGILSGFLLSKWKILHDALDPYIMALYCLPRVALAPLFIMWFGIGILSKVVLIISLVYFVLFFNTYLGVQNVDRDLINAIKTIGAGNTYLVRRVILPSCTPWIFGGLRIGIAMALIGAVVGEMLAAQFGLGFLLSRSAGAFDTTGTFGVLVILAVVGSCLYGLMKRFENRLLKWRGEGQIF